MRKLFSWKLGRIVGKIVVVVILFNINFGGVNTLTGASRTGSADMSAPSCCAVSDSTLTSDCLCLIDSKIDELFVDFQETWTILADCCSTITSIEGDFRETWTMIDACCEGLHEDFQETWTILGDQSEVAVGGIDTLDEINTSTLSIIAWLKTMYAQSRGLIT